MRFEKEFFLIRIGYKAVDRVKRLWLGKELYFSDFGILILPKKLEQHLLSSRFVAELQLLNLVQVENNTHPRTSSKRTSTLRLCASRPSTVEIVCTMGYKRFSPCSDNREYCTRFMNVHTPTGEV